MGFTADLLGTHHTITQGNGSPQVENTTRLGSVVPEFMDELNHSVELRFRRQRSRLLPASEASHKHGSEAKCNP